MISSNDIKKILENAGLTNPSFRPTPDGHYNDSYYVDSDEGKYVLRIAPPDDVPKLFYEIDMMRSEPEIHRIVKEKTDLPVPEVVCFDPSRELVDTDYILLRFLEGKPGYFDDKELGAYTRQIHDICGEVYGYPDRAAPTGESWPALFMKYAELIFEDCLSCGVIEKEEKEWFLDIYEKHADIFQDTSSSLLHLDLWSQNILTIDGKITGILDFDRGLYGDPELEFAVLDTYGYSTPAFFEGYGSQRPADKDAGIRQKLYIVYELIKYAFIRAARGGSLAAGRHHVEQCKNVIRDT